MDKIDPRETIFFSIEQAIKSYRKMAQRQIAAVMEHITVDQLLLLTLLESNPDITQKEMAELFFKDVASVTRMIDLLVKNDYLSRSVNESDRRKSILKISKKGNKTLKTLKPIIIQNRADALQDVSDMEINQLYATLNKIINNC